MEQYWSDQDQDEEDYEDWQDTCTWNHEEEDSQENLEQQISPRYITNNADTADNVDVPTRSQNPDATGSESESDEDREMPNDAAWIGEVTQVISSTSGTNTHNTHIHGDANVKDDDNSPRGSEKIDTPQNLLRNHMDQGADAPANQGGRTLRIPAGTPWHQKIYLRGWARRFDVNQQDVSPDPPENSNQQTNSNPDADLSSSTEMSNIENQAMNDGTNDNASRRIPKQPYIIYRCERFNTPEERERARIEWINYHMNNGAEGGSGRNEPWTPQEPANPAGRELRQEERNRETPNNPERNGMRKDEEGSPNNTSQSHSKRCDIGKRKHQGIIRNTSKLNGEEMRKRSSDKKRGRTEPYKNKQNYKKQKLNRQHHPKAVAMEDTDTESESASHSMSEIEWDGDVETQENERNQHAHSQEAARQGKEEDALDTTPVNAEQNMHTESTDTEHTNHASGSAQRPETGQCQEPCESNNPSPAARGNDENNVQQGPRKPAANTKDGKKQPKSNKDKGKAKQKTTKRGCIKKHNKGKGGREKGEKKGTNKEKKKPKQHKEMPDESQGSEKPPTADNTNNSNTNNITIDTVQGGAERNLQEENGHTEHRTEDNNDRAAGIGAEATGSTLGSLVHDDEDNDEDDEMREIEDIELQEGIRRSLIRTKSPQARHLIAQLQELCNRGELCIRAYKSLLTQLLNEEGEELPSDQESSVSESDRLRRTDPSFQNYHPQAQPDEDTQGGNDALNCDNDNANRDNGGGTPRSIITLHTNTETEPDEEEE